MNVTCGDKTLVIYIGMDLEIENALKYLVYFGYFDDKEELFNTDVKDIPGDVLIKFQDFQGLEKTGVLDTATLEVMKLPRRTSTRI